MPAYFSISVQFQRKDLYDGFVRDFYSALSDAGAKFHSGYGIGETDSYEEIIAWNQRKLDANFVLGYTQNVVHDYRQALYEFAGFTEVRGFWVNEELEEGVFDYNMIVIEEEVCDFEWRDKVASEWERRECVTIFKKEEIDTLLELAKKIWQFPYVRAIQTELEVDYGAVGLGALEAGEFPSIRPFTILEKCKCPLDEREYVVSQMEGRNGVCISLRKMEI